MKKIIYGSPPGSLGDMVTMLPLINHSDFTFETYPHNMRCDLLRENCKIVIREDFRSDLDSIEEFGHMEINNANKFVHSSIRFLKTFGVYRDDIDLIPKLKFTEHEESFSDNLPIFSLKPLLAFSIADARLYSPIKDWNPILRRLSEKFTLLQVSKNVPENIDVDFVDYSQMDSIRDTAVVLRSCKAFLGIDSGLMHLAVACGCNSYCVHDAVGTVRYHNYAYVPEMWRNTGKVKAHYYALNQTELLCSHLMSL